MDEKYDEIKKVKRCGLSIGNHERKYVFSKEYTKFVEGIFVSIGTPYVSQLSLGHFYMMIGRLGWENIDLIRAFKRLIAMLPKGGLGKNFIFQLHLQKRTNDK